MSGYPDRKVLVVGGLGYIGSHVTERLLARGARVSVVTRTLATHRDAAARLTAAGARVLEGDLRNAETMRAAIGGQDVVFHLAGRSGAVRSMDDPWTDLDVNVRGTLVLLEALRTESPACKLIFVSSRLSYGRGGPEPIAEEQPADPLCVHGVHKLAAEQYVRIYGRVHGLRSAIARITNPYGPGQPAARTAYGVVNQMIHRALANDVVPIYGDGSQQRDYIYVDDACEALIELGAAPAAAGVYNVGSGAGTRLVDMARRIVDLAGSGRLEFVPWPPLAGQIETGDFVANTERIRRDTGWTPRVGLTDGLLRTIAHYRSQVTTVK